MKNKEELTALKEEVETLNKKLAELSEEELAQVSGGLPPLVIKLNDIATQTPITGSYSTVTDDDILHEMKLPDFNLN